MLFLCFKAFILPYLYSELIYIFLEFKCFSFPFFSFPHRNCVWEKKFKNFVACEIPSDEKNIEIHFKLKYTKIHKKGCLSLLLLFSFA